MSTLDELAIVALNFALSVATIVTLRKVEGFAGALLTATAIWLHYLVATSAGPLWRDEAHAVGLATLPTAKAVWADLQYDSFPILWVLILREYAWFVGPMNDSAFRAFGLSVGLGVVSALWFAAWRFGHRVPLLSLALLAMSPSLIVWGDSIRAYGFGVLLLLLSGTLIFELVENPHPRSFA